MDLIYPAHANALRKVGLVLSVFPAMGELLEKQDEKLEKNKERDVIVKKNRNVYFCVAFSRYFSTAVHRVIDRLKMSFNLTWLRVRIYYHRYNNLAELLNGDLAGGSSLRWVEKTKKGKYFYFLIDRLCLSWSIRVCKKAIMKRM